MALPAFQPRSHSGGASHQEAFMQAIKSLSLGGSGRALVVIGLHVVVIYLVMTSMGIVKAPLMTEPMEAVLIEAPQESKPLPQTQVKPELLEPTLDIPQPDTVP